MRRKLNEFKYISSHLRMKNIKSFCDYTIESIGGTTSEIIERVLKTIDEITRMNG